MKLLKALSTKETTVKLISISKIVIFTSIGICAYQNPNARVTLLSVMFSLIAINYATTLITRKD